MRLDDEQRKLVQEHLYMVDWIIYKNIFINEAVQGLGREDLYQLGCMALCEAALTFDGRVQFKTYAQVFIKNALIDACRKIKTHMKHCCCSLEDTIPGTDLCYGEAKILAMDNQDIDSGIAEKIAIQFSKVKKNYSGVALKGVEALELRYKGYSGKEIAALYDTTPKLVFAWISRAKQKLRISGELDALLECCK